MHEWSESQRCNKKTIGCVPTMGFLHKGHASLIAAARSECDFVVTSIFVNPTQFAANEDLSKYPRDLEHDIELAKDNGCDIVFSPNENEIYPLHFCTTIHVGTLMEKFEGASRPSHFDGVALIVVKLFSAIKPHHAYFGQKDFQQTLLVKQVVRDLNLDVDIIVKPTIREDDGLAMSSRNVYLSAAERQDATILSHALHAVRDAIDCGEKNRARLNDLAVNVLMKAEGIEIDYAAVAEAATLAEPDVFSSGDEVVCLIAVRVGKTRLIDNHVVRVP